MKKPPRYWRTRAAYIDTVTRRTPDKISLQTSILYHFPLRLAMGVFFIQQRRMILWETQRKGKTGGTVELLP